MARSIKYGPDEMFACRVWAERTDGGWLGWVGLADAEGELSEVRIPCAGEGLFGTEAEAEAAAEAAHNRTVDAVARMLARGQAELN